MTIAVELKHEYFCLPRPGNIEPRIEQYRQTVIAEDGITPVRSVLVTRCIECAAASYDGVQPNR